MASGVRIAVVPALLATALVACSATRGRPAAEDATPPASGGGMDLAGASAAGRASGTAGAPAEPGATGTSGTTGAAGVDGAAGTPASPDAPDVPDAALLALAAACGVTDSTMVHAACPEAARVGQSACRLDDEPDPCSYFVFADDDPDHARAPIQACRSRCVALEHDPFWSGSCVQCARGACRPPTRESVVHELDVADCRQRPLSSCVGHDTTQLSLDATLSALLPRESGAYSELHNAFLQVVMQDGCPSRFYVPGSSDPLTRVLALLGPALADKRFDCALALPCGQIQGPDTLATP